MDFNASILMHYQPRQRIKKQRHYFANKSPLVKTMVFPVDVWM